MSTTNQRGRWDHIGEVNEKVAQPFQTDTVAHYDRTDPGRSLPGECVHDWHRVGRCRDGVFKCHWCHAVLTDPEP